MTIPPVEGVRPYIVVTAEATRSWRAVSYQHALEQHADGFPEEPVLSVSAGVAVSDEFSPDVVPNVVLPASLLAHLLAEDGSLGISRTPSDGQWLVGYEFGQEAEDSPMAGGAAYATAGTLAEAIGDVVGQLWLSVVEEEESDAQAT